jgi:hypothetical protein
MRQPSLGAVDVYEIHWRGGGCDLSHLWLFPVLQQKEGLRDGVSTAPMAFDQQVKCPHVPQGTFLQRLTATDEAMEGGRRAPGVMSRCK